MLDSELEGISDLVKIFSWCPVVSFKLNIALF